MINSIDNTDFSPLLIKGNHLSNLWAYKMSGSKDKCLCKFPGSKLTLWISSVCEEQLKTQIDSAYNDIR